MKLDAHRFALENGLRLVVVERPDAPVVAMRAVVDAGLRYESKPGLAWLAGRTLAAGAGERTEAELADALEYVGGALATSGMGFALKTLADDLPFALEVAADLLQRPRFENDAFERERNVALAEIEAEADLPRTVSLRALNRRAYGEHPLGRNPRGDPGAITRDDLLSYHGTHFAPADSVLAIAGAVDAAQVARDVERALGAWRTAAPSKPALPRPQLPDTPVEVLVATDSEQINLYAGHVGIERGHPDFATLRVLETILGAGPGFTDRLSGRIRDDLGLAYTVGASICASAGKEPGLFRAYVGCAPESWRTAQAEIVRAMREMQDGAPTADELDATKTYLAASYVFDFQTCEDTAMAVAGMEHFGLGLDYPERYVKAVEGVTAADVSAAARNHLHPERLITVAVGRVR